MSFSTAWECSFPNIMGLRDYFFIAIVLELPGPNSGISKSPPTLTYKQVTMGIYSQNVPKKTTLKIAKYPQIHLK